MQRGLIVYASHVLYKKVGVLSELEHGTAMHASGTATIREALWRIRANISRSDFVICPFGLFANTKSSLLSVGQG